MKCKSMQLFSTLVVFFFKNSYENFLLLFDLYLPNEMQCPDYPFNTVVSDAVLITAPSVSVLNIIWQMIWGFRKLYYSISFENFLQKETSYFLTFMLELHEMVLQKEDGDRRRLSVGHQAPDL